MPAVLSDRVVTFDASDTPQPVLGQYVRFSWSSSPVFRKIGNIWLPEQQPYPIVRVDGNGLWSATFPWPSETKPLAPNTPKLTITYPGYNGLSWAGVIPEGVAGPLSIDTLLSTYGWGLVTGAGSVPATVVQGPTGPAGPTGPTGATGPQGPAGGTSAPIRTVSVDTTLTLTDGTVFVSASGKTLTLPDATLVSSGTTLTLTIVTLPGVSNTTVAAHVGQTVQQATNVLLAFPLSSLTVQTNGSAWFIV